MPSPAPNHPRRPRRRLAPTALRGRRDWTFVATEVLAALATLHPTPGVPELAARLGWTVADLAPFLDAMERAGMVELWRDAGAGRVMLSAGSLAELGLSLDPRGERWRAGVALDCPSARSLRA